MDIDISSLTRPAVSCQCSHCFSSLAALENEWAKVSDSHAIAPGWMSIDRFRLSISPEHKSIPGTSDLDILRGRPMQDVRCRMCQQKLGVLGMLNNGPNIVWKLSKVSFREIVSMKTVAPCFKDGALERIMQAQKGSRDSEARPDIYPVAVDMLGQTRDQGPNIDYVNTLHQSIASLKHDFTALQIKFDGNNKLSAATGDPNNMLATFAIQSESIEKLKQDIEALKQENETLRKENEGFKLGSEDKGHPGTQSALFPDSRKRRWTDEFHNGRTEPIADSFDNDEDIINDSEDQRLSLSGTQETNGYPTIGVTTNKGETRGPPKQSAEENQPSLHHVEIRPGEPSENLNNPQAQIGVKRPRLSQGRRGRPRKSDPPKSIPLTERHKNEKDHHSTNERGTGRKRGRPSLAPQRKRGRPRTSRSRTTSVHRNTQNSPDTDNNNNNNNNNNASLEDQSQSADNTREGDKTVDGINPQDGSEKENLDSATKDTQTHDDEEPAEKRRKLIAKRDLDARVAMAREEAMEAAEDA